MVAPGTQFVAVMGEVHHGWLRWNSDKSVTHIIGRIADGYVPPARDELDCQDESQWPLSLYTGRPEDPWKKVLYVPLVSLDGERLLTFSTNSPTGLGSIWRFIDEYSWKGRSHPGQYPTIRIVSDGYHDKRFGWVDVPKFEIVGWTGRPDIALLTGGDGGGGGEDGAEVVDPAPSRDAFEDDIPFGD